MSLVRGKSYFEKGKIFLNYYGGDSFCCFKHIENSWEGIIFHLKTFGQKFEKIY